METAIQEKRERRQRGEGRIWQIGRIWWIQYYAHGRQVRESSHSDVKQVAKHLLGDRLTEVRNGISPAVKLGQVKYEHLRDALFADYRNNKRKSLRHLADGTELICGVTKLDDFFCGYKAINITTDRIRAFITKRQEERAPNGTINRSLALLRHMFKLAVQERKLRDVPHIPMLKEPAARSGFLKQADFQKLRNSLPEYLRPVFTLAYYTGMRLGEIRKLKWSNVSFADKEIRLDPGTTKNDDGRNIPLADELPQMLEILRQANPASEFVFTKRGRAIGAFGKTWASACVSLGFGKFGWRCKNEACRKRHENAVKKCEVCGKAVSRFYRGLIFHDLRRSGVRNLVRAGVPERVAMAISGHKTRSVFERYNIVDGRDIQDAARKLETYISEQNGASLGQIAKLETSKAVAAREVIN